MKWSKGFLFLCFGVFLLFTQSVCAETAETVHTQINNTTTQIKALNKEIEQYQKRISETGEQSRTLANLIKELTLTRNKLLKEAQVTEKKISITKDSIHAIDTTLTEDERRITLSKQALTKTFQEIWQQDHTPFIEKILLDTTIIDTSRDLNNMLDFKKRVHEDMVLLLQQQSALIDTKIKKEVEKQNLVTLKTTLDQKKLAVDITKKEKDTILKETKNKESNYKKLLADREKKRDAFEKELEVYEAQLKFILNPKVLPTEGKGVLAWPLDSVFVTQLFGKTVAAKRLYLSGSHSGVDFRAAVGTPVKSMGSGIVQGSGDTDLYCKGASFGKWVFIKYDNGLSSTYGHMSYISATTGQAVKAGDTVGLSGNSGHSTGPHLHVTVYASGGAEVKTVPSISCNGKTFTMPIASSSAYLDPMLYLPKIASSLIKSDTRKD